MHRLAEASRAEASASAESWPYDSRSLQENSTSLSAALAHADPYGSRANFFEHLQQLLSSSAAAPSDGFCNTITDSDGRSEALGVTPLHKAVQYGTVHTVRQLIASRADINARDRFGRTPLSRALNMCSGAGVADIMQLQMVELLLQAGAAVSVREISAAAEWAADCQAKQATAVDAGAPASGSLVSASTRLLELLITAAGGVDVQDSEGRTALGAAVCNRHPGAVRLLLRAGAALEVPSSSSTRRSRTYSVLHDAITWCSIFNSGPGDLLAPDLEVLALVTQAAARAGCLNSTAYPDPVGSGARKGNIAIVRLLLQHGALISDGCLASAVSRACRWFHSEQLEAGGYESAGNWRRGRDVVSALLNAAAKPNSAQISMLLEAAEVGCEPLVQLLLQAGTQFSQAGSRLDVLCRAACGGHLGVVQLLLDSGHVKSAAWIREVLQSVNATPHPHAAQVSVQLLLHLHKIGGTDAAVAALSGLARRMDDPAAVRMAILRHWAAGCAQVDAEHAKVGAREQQAAAFRQNLAELAVGFNFRVREQHVPDVLEQHRNGGMLAQPQQDDSREMLTRQQQDKKLGVLAGAEQHGSVGELTSSSSIPVERQKSGSRGMLGELQQLVIGDRPRQQQQQPAATVESGGAPASAQRQQESGLVVLAASQ